MKALPTNPGHAGNRGVSSPETAGGGMSCVHPGFFQGHPSQPNTLSMLMNVTAFGAAG